MTLDPTERREPGVEGEIEGVVIRPLRFFHDQRGWLVEFFRHDDVAEDHWPVMMYVSCTLPGVALDPTSMSIRPMDSGLSAPRISGSTCGIRPRQPDSRQSQGDHGGAIVSARQSGSRRAWSMRIGTWGKSPAWSSTRRTGCMPAGVRRNRWMRSVTRMPSPAGSRWTE